LEEKKKIEKKIENALSGGSTLFHQHLPGEGRQDGGPPGSYPRFRHQRAARGSESLVSRHPSPLPHLPSRNTTVSCSAETGPQAAPPPPVPQVNTRASPPHFSQNPAQILRIYPFCSFYSSQGVFKKRTDGSGDRALRAALRQDLASPFSARQRTARRV